MTPSKPNEGGREEGPSEGAPSTPSEEGIDGLSVEYPGSREVRLSIGPATVYAYHDYPMHPWRSPLYVGARLGSLSMGWLIPSTSRLRPFSGGRR